MEIIETSHFTKRVRAALSDEEFRAFQVYLIAGPDVGDSFPAQAAFGRCGGIGRTG